MGQPLFSGWCSKCFRHGLGIKVNAEGHAVFGGLCGCIGLFQSKGVLVHGQQGLHAGLARLLGEECHGGFAQCVILHAAFQQRGLHAQQVTRGRSGMVVQVVAEIEGLFVEAFAGHKGLCIQAHTVFVVQADDPQPQPLIQHHTRADIAVHTGHQAFKRQLTAFTGKARQGQGAAVFVQIAGGAQPHRYELRTQGDHIGNSVHRLCQLVAKAGYVFAMHPGHQADAAVGGSLVIQAEFGGSYIDKQVLQQFGEVGVSDALREHDPHQGAQYAA